LLLAGLCIGASSVRAQAPHRFPAVMTQPVFARGMNDNAGLPFLLSAVLPGAGQYQLGKDRWVAFLALETWAWATYFDQKSHGRQLERRYRDLAWSVARRVDAITRRDTVFAYYEAMADLHDSGRFDMDPLAAGVQPELDTLTYNGKQWQLAKSFYFPRGLDFVPGTQEYEAALQYYRTNAIPVGYGWSWEQSELEQEFFGRLIGESDDAFRRATRSLGLILANHVASAIDALVTARLQAVSEGARRLRVGSELEPAGTSILWRTTVRFTLGN
jgi:hypothetical protein